MLQCNGVFRHQHYCQEISSLFYCHLPVPIGIRMMKIPLMIEVKDNIFMLQFFFLHHRPHGILI
jgi:hypothetical protein